MEIFEHEQRSPEWFQARMGIPTASEFKTVLSKGVGKAPSKTRRTYMLKLAGEIITGQPMDSFSNAHMERGIAMEPEARAWYEFLKGVDTQPVGFIRNGNTGCSPDALVGGDGLLEVKTKLPHLLGDVLTRGEFPSEYIAQCQGQLWISGRAWLDLVIYWPDMPTFITRVQRDEDFIAALTNEVKLFNMQLDDLVEQIREYGS